MFEHGRPVHWTPPKGWPTSFFSSALISRQKNLIKRPTFCRNRLLFGAGQTTGTQTVGKSSRGRQKKSVRRRNFFFFGHQNQSRQSDPSRRDLHRLRWSFHVGHFEFFWNIFGHTSRSMTFIDCIQSLSANWCEIFFLRRFNLHCPRRAHSTANHVTRWNASPIKSQVLIAGGMFRTWPQRLVQ